MLHGPCTRRFLWKGGWGGVRYSSRRNSTARTHRMERSIAPNRQSICRSRRSPTTCFSGLVVSCSEKASQVENSTVHLFFCSRRLKNITYAFIQEYELKGTCDRELPKHSPNRKFEPHFSFPVYGRHTLSTRCTPKPP